MNLVDVTLRDGGFTCDFDWPMHFAHEYYNLMSNLGISYIEMGYWKQTVKSKNKFFNLDLDTVKEVTGEQGKNNVSVMIDYSYCSKDLNEYPTDSQNEIKMIRMTCRKDMIKEGFEFAVNLKKHTNLEIAFNLFNTTNYTDDELNSALDIVLDSDFDIIGFADTHGHLNLHRDIKRYEYFFKRKTVSPYLMVTGRYGITDHYATQARKLELDMNTFVKFCSTVTGLDRDNFDKNLLISFESYRWLL